MFVLVSVRVWVCIFVHECQHVGMCMCECEQARLCGQVIRQGRVEGEVPGILWFEDL